MSLSSLKRLPDNTIEILTTVTSDKVEEEHKQILTQLQKTTELAGFRKGKAPRSQVEKTVGKEKVYNETAKNLIPKIYSQLIQEHQLHPIINPKIELISAQEGKDWQIKFTVCETPTVNLGNYKEEIKKITAKNKIWTPEKEEQSPKEDKKNKTEEKTQEIIKALLRNVKIAIPQILIENEVNQKLASLIEKTEKLGLTLDQYLNSLGKTAEQIKKEYQKESQDNWHLELTLNKIADQEKITVDNEEIDKIIADSKNEKEKENLSHQRYMLAFILKQRKTLEFLQNL
ncbi:hypothetical protein COT63_01480 [Candidatus Shapirobacteria bacterium CG09_land_8_20_14_0_10_38_17]|uniref:Trigger factor n=1 Tax=Candidatus Shapirobacteria bacterium CG09_land_8_20_14_0_10_38_17 TaxID=1974884 RepID=A0A2H0WR81_9BACT|nr:MAG: hypothetical protein COT63_01480 [Candidatus Shapirobacteria bacterium CG09_land_8_20_14_0_10_38_17]